MEYELIRSKRKTLSMEITKDKKIIIRAPLKCSQKVIDSFFEANEAWAEATIVKIEKRNRIKSKYEIPDSEKEKYIEMAKLVLPQKTNYYAQLMGVNPSYVKITQAKSRFGSCNGKNGICYSYRIMAYPDEAIDYVVVHELAHIKYKNHGKEFYAFIESILPDYKQRENILKHKE